MTIGYVYKLVCKDIEVKEIYVGSTTNITKRKCEHKCRCNNKNGHGYNYPVFLYIRANGGFENWEMIVIERVEYNEKYELKTRERFHLEELKATLNKQVPNRTVGEWNDDNREHRHQYYLDNKEHNKQYKQQYQQDNKEQIKQRNQQYRQDNREQLSQYTKQKHNCGCGGKYTNANRNIHEKTKRHQEHINN